jgi:hypothetical protein
MPTTANELPPTRRPAQTFPFAARVVLTLALLAILNGIGRPLMTSAAPAGIVSYEFAGGEARAREIMASWDEPARRLAAFSLGLDYLFMVAYATTLAAGCLRSGAALRRNGWPLAAAGRTVARAQWAAALCDALENLGLALLLMGAPAAFWPAVAAWAAGLKFVLIALGLAFSAYGGFAWLYSRLVNKTRDKAGIFP